MLSTIFCIVQAMSYSERLKEAMKMANFNRPMLAKATGKSVQAIGQCLTGVTGALTAENSARAASAMKVDHFWLATGEGQARPDRAWPFKLFLPEQYDKLDKKYRDDLEDRILGRIHRQQIEKAVNVRNG